MQTKFPVGSKVYYLYGESKIVGTVVNTPDRYSPIDSKQMIWANWNGDYDIGWMSADEVFLVEPESTLNKYTVVYTFSTRAGPLVSHAQITLQKGQLLDTALKLKNIDPGSLVLVFPGHHDSIETNWSEIEGE